MTKTQIYKYNKAKVSCKKFLKATYGVHDFILSVLVNLKHGNIKKVQKSLEKVGEFLSPEDYNSFKADMLGYRGSVVYCEGEWRDLVGKWEDIFTKYFLK